MEQMDDNVFTTEGYRQGLYEGIVRKNPKNLTNENYGSGILPLEEDKTSIFLGGFLGGLLGAFFSLCYFVVKKLFRDTLKENSPNSLSQSL